MNDTDLVKGDVGARHFAFVGPLCESQYTMRGAEIAVFSNAIGPREWVRFANLQSVVAMIQYALISRR